MAIVTQQISGQLNLKFIAAYFQRAHKNADIRVQRCAEDTSALYITDGSLAVKVPFSATLVLFSFGWDIDWQRATFPKGNESSQEGGYDIEALFRSYDRSLALNNHTLTVTPFLLEIPGTTNKPGELSRRLFFMGTDDAPDEILRTEVYIEKRAMDMLNPDLDALAGFLFETSGHEKPVRVSAVNGIVAYLMPKINIERYLRNTW